MMMMMIMMMIIIIIIMQRIRNVKAKVIPVITGESGTISRSFRKHDTTEL